MRRTTAITRDLNSLGTTSPTDHDLRAYGGAAQVRLVELARDAVRILAERVGHRGPLHLAGGCNPPPDADLGAAEGLKAVQGLGHGFPGGGKTGFFLCPGTTGPRRRGGGPPATQGQRGTRRGARSA